MRPATPVIATVAAPMLGSEPVLERAAADAPGPTEGPSARVSKTLRDRPLTSIFIVCLILGIISVLVLPWVPSSDPYAWISWGQEFASHIVGTKIALSYHGGPSFKPFPVIFTSIFGLFGNAAPGLWLVVSRTSSLLALVGIFRLGRRFGGTPAGILAAVALCFTADAVFYMARGTSEPVVAAVTVWAIDRHLDGAKRTTYFLLFLGALNRPEFTPIMFLYGLWLWVTEPDTRTRAYAIVLLVLVPILWTFPPGIVNGDFLQAKNAAAGGQGSPGTAFAELKSSAGQLTDGILLLAAIGYGLACLRRNRTLIWLGAAAILWAVMVALITQFFYGLPRYLLPASVIACVFAAVSVVWLAEMAAERVPAGASKGGRTGGRRRRGRGDAAMVDRPRQADGHTDTAGDRLRDLSARSVHRRRPARRQVEDLRLPPQLRRDQPHRREHARVEAEGRPVQGQAIDGQPGLRVRRPARLRPRPPAPDRLCTSRQREARPELRGVACVRRLTEGRLAVRAGRLALPGPRLDRKPDIRWPAARSCRVSGRGDRFVVPIHVAGERGRDFGSLIVVR